MGQDVPAGVSAVGKALDTLQVEQAGLLRTFFFFFFFSQKKLIQIFRRSCIVKNHGQMMRRKRAVRNLFIAKVFLKQRSKAMS